MAPEVGSQAPDFTLKDQNNQNVTLSSLRGQRNVLLVFYPFAYSSCAPSRTTSRTSRTRTCRSSRSPSTTRTP
jgi:peroxiredoxin